MLRYLLFLLAVFFFPTLSYAASPQTAIFGMGCFWCAQSDFDKFPGVVQTQVGYDGGSTPSPTYEQVSSGTTHYVESIKVTFDPDKTSYSKLLEYFWHNIDPSAQNAQFCDKGGQYRSVIFYTNETQKKEALASLAEIKQKFPEVYTEITASTQFYPAEEYHQKYYQKNPTRYHFYRWNCGRDKRLKEIWHA